MKLDALRKRYGTGTAVESRPIAAPGVAAHLSGTLVPIGTGASFYREVAYDGHETHGPHRFDDVATISGEGASLVTGDAELAYADLPHAVFLDTETTGLGMGVGTYVFLVGAGYLDGSGFRVRQFFLGAPGDESAFLAELSRFLSAFGTLVSFNGKAFDWPLLENRYVLHRSPAPLANAAHLDLLHPARRLWKRRLESCALTSLEREILRLTRTEDDVPGWQIPALYFEYLRRGDGRPLSRVFYHNLQDILSLASLTVRVHRLLENPLSDLMEDPLDYVSIGKVFERAGRGNLAIACYEEALTRGIDGPWRRECLYGLAGCFKRLRVWDRAVRAWEMMIDDGGAGALLALVEIAKYYEHVERDYLLALDNVQQALNVLELRPDLDVPVDVGELEHRRARLLNRVYRNRSWVGAGV